MSASPEQLSDYIASRRKTIEATIAAEELAGNRPKAAMERKALAEITALEIWLSMKPTESEAGK